MLRLFNRLFLALVLILLNVGIGQAANAIDKAINVLVETQIPIPSVVKNALRGKDISSVVDPDTLEILKNSDNNRQVKNAQLKKALKELITHIETELNQRAAAAAASNASTAAVDLARQEEAERARVKAEAEKLAAEETLRLANEKAAAQKLESDRKIRETEEKAAAEKLAQDAQLAQAAQEKADAQSQLIAKASQVEQLTAAVAVVEEELAKSGGDGKAFDLVDATSGKAKGLVLLEELRAKTRDEKEEIQFAELEFIAATVPNFDNAQAISKAIIAHNTQKRARANAAATESARIAAQQDRMRAAVENLEKELNAAIDGVKANVDKVDVANSFAKQLESIAELTAVWPKQSFYPLKAPARDAESIDRCGEFITFLGDLHERSRCIYGQGGDGLGDFVSMRQALFINSTDDYKLLAHEDLKEGNISAFRPVLTHLNRVSLLEKDVTKRTMGFWKKAVKSKAQLQINKAQLKRTEDVFGSCNKLLNFALFRSTEVESVLKLFPDAASANYFAAVLKNYQSLYEELNDFFNTGNPNGFRNSMPNILAKEDLAPPLKFRPPDTNPVEEFFREAKSKINEFKKTKDELSKALTDTAKTKLKKDIADLTEKELAAAIADTDNTSKVDAYDAAVTKIRDESATQTAAYNAQLERLTAEMAAQGTATDTQIQEENAALIKQLSGDGETLFEISPFKAILHSLVAQFPSLKDVSDASQLNMLFAFILDLMAAKKPCIVTKGLSSSESATSTEQALRGLNNAFDIDPASFKSVRDYLDAVERSIMLEVVLHPVVMPSFDLFVKKGNIPGILSLLRVLHKNFSKDQFEAALKLIRIPSGKESQGLVKKIDAIYQALQAKLADRSIDLDPESEPAMADILRETLAAVSSERGLKLIKTGLEALQDFAIPESAVKQISTVLQQVATATKRDATEAEINAALANPAIKIEGFHKVEQALLATSITNLEGESSKDLKKNVEAFSWAYLTKNADAGKTALEVFTGCENAWVVGQYSDSFLQKISLPEVPATAKELVTLLRDPKTRNGPDSFQVDCKEAVTQPIELAEFLDSAKEPLIFAGGSGNERRVNVGSSDRFDALYADLNAALAIKDFDTFIKKIAHLHFINSPLLAVRPEDLDFILGGASPGQLVEILKRDFDKAGKVANWAELPDAKKGAKPTAKAGGAAPVVTAVKTTNAIDAIIGWVESHAGGFVKANFADDVLTDAIIGELCLNAGVTGDVESFKIGQASIRRKANGMFMSLQAPDNIKAMLRQIFTDPVAAKGGGAAPVAAVIANKGIKVVDEIMKLAETIKAFDETGKNTAIAAKHKELGIDALADLEKFTKEANSAATMLKMNQPEGAVRQKLLKTYPGGILVLGVAAPVVASIESGVLLQRAGSSLPVVAAPPANSMMEQLTARVKKKVVSDGVVDAPENLKLGAFLQGKPLANVPTDGEFNVLVDELVAFYKSRKAKSSLSTKYGAILSPTQALVDFGKEIPEEYLKRLVQYEVFNAFVEDVKGSGDVSNLVTVLGRGSVPVLKADDEAATYSKRPKVKVSQNYINFLINPQIKSQLAALQKLGWATRIYSTTGATRLEDIASRAKKAHALFKAHTQMVRTNIFKELSLLVDGVASGDKAVIVHYPGGFPTKSFNIKAIEKPAFEALKLQFRDANNDAALGALKAWAASKSAASDSEKELAAHIKDLCDAIDNIDKMQGLYMVFDAPPSAAPIAAPIVVSATKALDAIIDWVEGNGGFIPETFDADKLTNEQIDTLVDGAGVDGDLTQLKTNLKSGVRGIRKQAPLLLGKQKEDEVKIELRGNKNFQDPKAAPAVGAAAVGGSATPPLKSGLTPGTVSSLRFSAMPSLAPVVGGAGTFGGVKLSSSTGAGSPHSTATLGSTSSLGGGGSSAAVITQTVKDLDAGALLTYSSTTTGESALFEIFTTAGSTVSKKSSASMLEILDKVVKSASAEKYKEFIQKQDAARNTILMRIFMSYNSSGSNKLLIELIEKLIKADPQLLLIPNNSGMTPLDFAIASFSKKDFAQVADAAVAKISNLNFNLPGLDSAGNSLLMRIFKRFPSQDTEPHRELCLQLLSRNPDMLLLPNTEGEAPFDYALQKFKQPALEWIVDFALLKKSELVFVESGVMASSASTRRALTLNQNPLQLFLKSIWRNYVGVKIKSGSARVTVEKGNIVLFAESTSKGSGDAFASTQLSSDRGFNAKQFTALVEKLLFISPLKALSDQGTIFVIDENQKIRKTTDRGVVSVVDYLVFLLLLATTKDGKGNIDFITPTITALIKKGKLPQELPKGFCCEEYAQSGSDTRTAWDGLFSAAIDHKAITQLEACLKAFNETAFTDYLRTYDVKAAYNLARHPYTNILNTIEKTSGYHGYLPAVVKALTDFGFDWAQNDSATTPAHQLVRVAMNISDLRCLDALPNSAWTVVDAAGLPPYASLPYSYVVSKLATHNKPEVGLRLIREIWGAMGGISAGGAI